MDTITYNIKGKKIDNKKVLLNIFQIIFAKKSVFT